MTYSFFSEGKRFRPYLSFLAGQVLNLKFDDIFPIALAIEMVHSYSLIHDDLPCMDNDDLRRGKPTNHKVFGESIALLAGDALLSESFQVLAKANRDSLPDCIQIFTTAIGSRGMVLGQVLDMQADANLNLEQLKNIHALKTGNLIAASIEMVACLKMESSIRKAEIKKLGQLIGLAFQVKDDLLDANDKDQDFKSFIRFLGVDGTTQFLHSLSKDCLSLIEEHSFSDFIEVIHFNQTRKK